MPTHGLAVCLEPLIASLLDSKSEYSKGPKYSYKTSQDLILETTQNNFLYILLVKALSQNFLGGPVVKNPASKKKKKNPASNAGHKGLIPIPGRSHMPWSS